MVIKHIDDGIINRINDALLRYIRKRSGAVMGPIVSDGEGVRLMRDATTMAWSIPWRNVVRITALWHPSFVGETMLVAIEADEQSQPVSEEHEGWASFVESLPVHLSGALPFPEWSLKLVAGGDEATVTVYERA
jgi:hypothetical protein